MKLREVNLGRFLTIVELFYSDICVYFFGIELYFMWPFVAYLK